jgi:hypothetical protein
MSAPPRPLVQVSGPLPIGRSVHGLPALQRRQGGLGEGTLDKSISYLARLAAPEHQILRIEAAPQVMLSG